mmetsp:Transcript_6608/g.16889  ORF Transcript_6608/g.16889 Transcript_6608/m.16889 type:complete len:244 (-) Transcript_6608:589-1320(-)
MWLTTLSPAAPSAFALPVPTTYTCAYPVSRSFSLGPCPGLGSTPFCSSHRVGGNMSMAPKKPTAAVPAAAAPGPEHRSLSSYAKLDPYCSGARVAERPTTLVLTPAMMLGMVQRLVSGSNLNPLWVFHLASSAGSVGAVPAGARKCGEPIFCSVAHGVVVTRLMAEAMVPPLTPPFAAPMCPTASVHSSPLSRKYLATAQAPRSHGTLSYPTQLTMHVPDFLAAASCLSTTARMKVGSPVMSQ